MDRKFLEGLGLEKEVIDKVLDQNGAEVTALRAQLTTKDTEIKTLRTDLTTANTKIADLEKVDIEDLQTQLQTEKKARAKDKQEFVLKTALAKEGCNDIEYIMYKLGDTVKFDDKGEISDKENFIKSTKEAYKNQFTESGAGGTGGTGNFPRTHEDKTPPEKNPYTKKGWNMTQQMELELTDPDKAKKLKLEAKVE